MSSKIKPKAKPEPEVHDVDEVAKAVGDLSTADKVRLFTSATAWVYSFGLDHIRHEPEDLLYETMTRTLSGKRKWKKGVDFIRHLRLAMRSIADSWRKQLDRQAEADLEEMRQADFQTPSEDAEQDDAAEPADPLRDAACPVPTQDRAPLAREQLLVIGRRFKDDPEAMAMLKCWKTGMTGPETEKTTGMSRKQRLAATRKIRRFAQQLRGEEDGDAH